MLEDDFTYVVRKALRGHGISTVAAITGRRSSVAAITGRRPSLLEHDILSFLEGNFSEPTARQLATLLGLDPDALARHPEYLPRPLPSSGGIHRLLLPFRGDHVNAWLLQHEDSSILFDTGHEPGSCAREIERLGLPHPQKIFITHAHSDHIGGLPDLKSPAWGQEIDEASPFAPGQKTSCGPFTLRACDLSGHASPSLGYHVEGTGTPILITGDALFAGSMGGCATPKLYLHALERLHAVLDPLPAETILLPGHGPATTLEEERTANPFFAAKARS